MVRVLPSGVQSASRLAMCLGFSDGSQLVVNVADCLFSVPSSRVMIPPRHQDSMLSHIELWSRVLNTCITKPQFNSVCRKCVRQ